MNNTTYADLKRWDPEDRILLKDFNENWGKIDEKLNQMARFGNCRIEFGVYTGDGEIDTAKTLTFAGKPLLVFVGLHTGGTLIMLRAAQSAQLVLAGGAEGVTAAWEGNSVSWRDRRFKNSGSQYPYLALFAADD